MTMRSHGCRTRGVIAAPDVLPRRTVDRGRRLARGRTQDLPVVAERDIVTGPAEDGVVGVGLARGRRAGAAGRGRAAADEVVVAEVALDPVDVGPPST